MRIITVPCFVLVLMACGAAADDLPDTRVGPPVIEIRAVDHAFTMPSTIDAGWTTFRMPNNGTELHVAIFVRLPEGRTFEEWVDARAETPRPAWLGEVEELGGVGALSHGQVAETTMLMAPGEYVVVCGARTADGTPHFRAGMQAPLTVRAAQSGAPEPAATTTLSVRNSTFSLSGPVPSGPAIVAVDFVEQTDPDHDVHLVRLDRAGDREAVVAYMRQAIAPAPATFLGGVEQLPAGQRAYLHLDLAPGRYAWVCHLHSGTGMVLEFEVS